MSYARYAPDRVRGGSFRLCSNLERSVHSVEMDTLS